MCTHHAVAGAAPLAVKHAMPEWHASIMGLPDDALLWVFSFVSFHERLHLALLCRRLRALSERPSELWREVLGHVQYAGAGLPGAAERGTAALRSFYRWDAKLLCARCMVLVSLPVALRGQQRAGRFL